ncbi:MAG: GNAT family N-acetyltransferase [Candidatus Sericytochromatia bacterium]
MSHITIRPLPWPADREAVLQLETGFSTQTVLRVIQQPHGFVFKPESVDPPLLKSYDLAAEVDDLPGYTCALVAECAHKLVGLTAFKLETWNQRAHLVHFYLAPAVRGKGLGRQLMQATLDAAKSSGARALWLETQNVNYGAICFYERLGFVCCGLDTTLYNPGLLPGEVALFYAYALV